MLRSTQNQSIDVMVRQLRSDDKKITPVRKEMLTIIASMTAAMTADDFLATLHQHGQTPHRATVYREIDFCVKEGFLRVLQIAGVSSVFYDRTAGEPRHHFVCERCHHLTAIPTKKIEKVLQQFEKKIEDEHHVHIHSHQIKFYGLCEQCEGQIHTHKKHIA